MAGTQGSSAMVMMAMIAGVIVMLLFVVFYDIFSD